MSLADDIARAEAQARAMQGQQQVAVALLQVELRDRFAIAAMGRIMPHDDAEDRIRQAYECADLMLRIRQEPPVAPPIPAQP